MEIGPERLSIPLPLETPAGHLDSKSISAPVKRLSDPWPASSGPDRGESILYLFYWINSILPVPTRYTYLAASYKLLRCCVPLLLLSKPRPLPWRFLCPGFSFTFGLNIGFQSTLRLMMELQVIKTESKAHNPSALWFALPGPSRTVSCPHFFPLIKKQRPLSNSWLTKELFGKCMQENIKHWEYFLLENQKWTRSHR